MASFVTQGVALATCAAVLNLGAMRRDALAGDLAADDALYVRALAESYLANRESFPYWSVEFTVATGYAPTVGAAVTSGPTEDVVQANGKWARDGDVERYEVLRDMRKGPKPMRIPGFRGVAVRLPPQVILVNAQHALSVSGDRLDGSVGLLRDVPHDVPYTTWNLAGEAGEGENLAFGNAIANYFPSDGVEIAVERRSAVQGLPSIEITFVGDNAGRRFFVDESSGSIPREVWLFRQGQVTRKVFVTDVRRCAGDRWFPTRVVSVILDEQANGRVHATDVRVARLEVDRRPTARELSVSLPRGTVLNDGATIGAQFHLDRARVVSANDLEPLMSTALQVAKRRQSVEMQSATGPGWRSGLVMAGLLSVLLAVFCVLRMRK